MGGIVLIILWIVIVLFAIMGIALISGKGSWLVAGYNTMSKEEKANCDIKKISRAVGIFLLVVDMLMVILSVITQYAIKNNVDYIIDNVVWGFSFVVIVGCIILVIIIQKYDKNNK